MRLTEADCEYRGQILDRLRNGHLRIAAAEAYQPTKRLLKKNLVRFVIQELSEREGYSPEEIATTLNLFYHRPEYAMIYDYHIEEVLDELQKDEPSYHRNSY